MRTEIKISVGASVFYVCFTRSLVILVAAADNNGINVEASRKWKTRVETTRAISREI